MGDIKKAIFDMLTTDVGISAKVSNRVVPQIANTKLVSPYIVYMRTSLDVTRHLSGISTIFTDTFTFKVYADTRLEVETIKDLVTTKMNTITRDTYVGVELISAFQQGESDDYDLINAGEQEPAYNETFSFVIWYR